MLHTLPRELESHVFWHVTDREDLRNSCRVSKEILSIAQPRLFSEVRLPRAPIYAARLCSCLEGSPHLRPCVKKLVLQGGFLSDSLEPILSMLPSVRALTLRNDTFKTDLIRALEKNTFSNITRLSIEDATIHLSILDSSPRLETLILQKRSEFYRVGQISSLQLPLRLLSIDAWRSSRHQRLNDLVSYLEKQCFPSLDCIRLPFNEHRYECPIDDVHLILNPSVRSNLTVLDLDIWHIEFGSKNGSASIRIDPPLPQPLYSLNDYPRLRCLRLGYHHPLDSLAEWGTLRIHWIANLFLSLTQTHPLEKLVLAPNTDYDPEFEIDGEEDEEDPPLDVTLSTWSRMDARLQSDHLPNFNELAIQVLDEDYDEMKLSFETAFTLTNTNGMLTFREVDLEGLFASYR
ncbi:hypothetical protein DL96DRAFT_1623275 [Flagelloscypha sp. PMI_526]|nr:hypothetical protein DL96DRAFT_1623275 [Flagelloscypha sp. PMI_526]